jgi:hypothetical protein
MRTFLKNVTIGHFYLTLTDAYAFINGTIEVLQKIEIASDNYSLITYSLGAIVQGSFTQSGCESDCSIEKLTNGYGINITNS